MNRLYIIGSGPGGLEHLSPAAHAALESCTDLAAEWARERAVFEEIRRECWLY